MARLALIGALIAGLLVIGQAGLINRHLLQKMASASSTSDAQSNDPDGMATATSEAFSTMGSTVSESFASTEVTEMALAEVQKMWADYQLNVTDDTSCDDAIAAADVAVDSRLEAVAEVYSTSFGSVTVEGTGEGCTDATAAGDATATAYLQVILDVVVAAKFEDEDSKDGAFAKAYGELVGAGVATAWSDAFANACASAVDGTSSALAEQTSFARATAVPAIVAFAWAQVNAACGEAASESEVAGEVSFDGDVQAKTTTTSQVTGTGTAGAGGDAGAGSNEITDPQALFEASIVGVPQCRGLFGICCRRPKDAPCRCTNSSNERAFRCNVEATTMGETTLWEGTDRNGADTKCVCK